MTHTIISAKCHIIEPATMFEGRMPQCHADAAPRIVEHPGGGVQWTFDGMARPLLSSCADVGIPRDDWTRTVLCYEDMRPGCYDAKAPLADMDVDGVYATASYSSPASMGFAGDLFSRTKDADLGIAALRAWNDRSVHYSPLHRAGWPTHMEPIDLIRRNFVFSTLEVDTARMVEEGYGITGWMLEADYPYMESVWPETQSYYAEQLQGLSVETVRGLTWSSAANLFRHPVPLELQCP